MTISALLTQLFAEETLSKQVSLLEAINHLSFSGQLFYEAVQFLYAHSTRLALKPPILDISGTGGDGSGSFNISTTAAFVLAGAGIPVLKHGNVSISSRSGAFDCLKALGMTILESPEAVKMQFEQHGLSFAFAPYFHPLFAKIRAARKVFTEAGQKTLFNYLGPLLNPAHITHQAIGVANPALLHPMAEAVHLLKRQALVYHSNGMDELTPCYKNEILKVTATDTQEISFMPTEFGLALASLEDLKGGNPDENAHITRTILNNELKGPKRDTVVLNAGAAISLFRNISLADGLTEADQVLASGQAYKKLFDLTSS